MQKEDSNNQYGKLSLEDIKRVINDTLPNDSLNKFRPWKIYITAYIDENNNLVSPMLDMFDKAMKENNLK